MVLDRVWRNVFHHSNFHSILNYFLSYFSYSCRHITKESIKWKCETRLRLPPWFVHKNTLLKCNLPFIILINRLKSSSSFKCLWKGKNSNNNKQSSRWRRRSDLHQRFLFIYIIHSFSCHQQHHQINFDFSLQ